VSRSRWENVLSVRPLVAILRGLRPEEAADIGQALVAAGILCAEVPLNSPNAPDSIAILKRAHGHKLMVGAGTVIVRAAELEICPDGLVRETCTVAAVAS